LHSYQLYNYINESDNNGRIKTMSYLRKHSFFLIVVFALNIFVNKFYFLDLNMFYQWSFSFILAIVDLFVFIPLMWFWTEKRFDAKQYRKIKYLNVLHNHPYRLLLQYLAIILGDLAVSRLSQLPLITVLLVSFITIVILTPVHEDYFTNAHLKFV